MKREKKLIGSKKLNRTEIPGVYKVSEGILINKDNEALSNYKKRKEVFNKNKKKMDTLESKVNSIAEDMEEIKSLLRNLMAK